MSFPQTRQTLIRRLAAEGGERDWHEFLGDYWLPLCRFAQRRANLTAEDAEDVASQTLEAVLRNRLLARWTSDRSAKLRTLLCTVVRHVLANRARVQAGRRRLLRRDAHELLQRTDLPTIKALDAPARHVDALHAAWVEGLLFNVIGALMREYHRTGRGDCFRVLYSRICERMTMPQISQALGITTTRAENYYKSASKRLSAKLREQVRRHVIRYCPPQAVDEEFAAEWAQIGQYLKKHGGLEEAIAKACADIEPSDLATRQARAISATLQRLTAAPVEKKPDQRR